MHFYGPTRKLLKAGGLDLEDENFLRILSHNKKWNDLISCYLNNELEPSKLLYLIRTLFYLGFYEQGIQLCKKIDSEKDKLEDRITALYFQELGQSVNDFANWSPLLLLQTVSPLRAKISDFTSFHIYLLIAKFFTRNSTDLNSAKEWLDKAAELINNNSDFFANNSNSSLAQLRLNKYLADFYFKLGKKQEARSLLIHSCELSDASTSKVGNDLNNCYLFLETKRRILDALTFSYYADEDLERALESAQESVRIDPYCSYALLVAGKVSMNIDHELSDYYFEKASQYGILERPYAKYVLSQRLQKKYPLRSRGLRAEAFDGGLFLLPEKSTDASTIKLPIEMKLLKEIAGNHSEAVHWDLTKKTETYQRFLPFWELRPPTLKSPIFCSGPLTALKSFEDKNLPWFNTLYLQRAMPINFREELFFAVSPHSLFSISHQSLATTVGTLQNRSEEAEFLLSTYRSIETLPNFDRVLFCRLLGSLGFYEEALKWLPVPDKNASWCFVDEYIFCTKLFLEHIYFAGTNSFPYRDIEFAFEKLSTQPESIRMRLALTILGSVYHGKRKNIDDLKEWREKGFESLILMQNSPYFEEFEKQLLTSRFYRAVSFYPFLTSDKKTLQEEAKICESYARSLTPQTEMQRLLYRENLFPMLESMARIHNHLGESEVALSLMEEIVYKIDPHDAKAWIQVGEAREKNGDFEKALEAFQTAENLMVPLGGIACYRAGRVCEKIGDLNQAKHYYFRSLKLCPKGLSPLKRLQTIAKKLDDSYLKNWSETSINKLINHFGSS